jgi:hypothetical protein
MKARSTAVHRNCISMTGLTVLSSSLQYLEDNTEVTTSCAAIINISFIHRYLNSRPTYSRYDFNFFNKIHKESEEGRNMRKKFHKVNMLKCLKYLCTGVLTEKKKKNFEKKRNRCTLAIAEKGRYRASVTYLVHHHPLDKRYN